MTEPLESPQYLFEPEDVDPEKFLAAQKDSNIHVRVIDDVLAEIKPAFAEDGLPPSLLVLLKKLWLHKLGIANDDEEEDVEDGATSSDDGLGIANDDEEEDGATSSHDGSFHGFTDSDIENTPKRSVEPLPVELGARPKVPLVSGSIEKPDESSKTKNKQTIIPQLDGPNNSSSSSEVDNDDDDDDDDIDDALNDDEDDVDGASEDEPLGSGDDISDEDPSELFNTENVVVCQYDKITRTRNKWKFHLKDGIMNLNGKDYVFQRATGEAAW
jgi:hypothetical protein